MSQEQVLKTLLSLGLSEIDAKVYVFLAKRGLQKGKEITTGLKINKSQLYRSIKKLQSKGIVSATLEHPSKFAAIPFEKVLDLLIKTKIEEAKSIQQDKGEILSVWKALQVSESNEETSRFMVLEGRNCIHSKIEQMIEETTSQLSAILTVPSLVRADQSGLLDFASERFSKSMLQLRFLTHLSEQEINPMKAFMKRKVLAEANFKGRVPDLGLRPFPRMFIRDEEEILFFLKSKSDKSITEQDDICLWTNNNELVKAFSAVFEDYWLNATEIGKKITEIETGCISPETCVIKSSEEAQQKYETKLDTAKNEIILLTTSEGLRELSQNLPSLKKWNEKCISVRVLAPITGENLNEALRLLKCCEVRHITTSYLSTTIVDNQHLFQFKNPPLNNNGTETVLAFENTFYSNDVGYVEKTITMLNGIWRDAPVPSALTIDVLEKLSSIPNPVAASSEHEGFRMMNKVSAYDIGDANPVTEKSILNKIINAKKYPVQDPYKDLTRGYGHSAQAVIHPPNFLKLPDFMIHAFHHDKQSSYGLEDYMIIYLLLNTPKGFRYVPAAIVSDVQEGQAGLKALFEGTPAGQNVIIVKKDEIRVQMQGNTFFVGWTASIPLLSSKYVLPPSAILLEAYGDLKAKAYTIGLPSGFKVTVEENVLEAFVTFYNSSSRYSGPGTEGMLSREIVMTTFPPGTG